MPENKGVSLQVAYVTEKRGTQQPDPEASRGGLLAVHAPPRTTHAELKDWSVRQPTDRMSNYRASSFQLTRSAGLILAYQVRATPNEGMRDPEKPVALGCY